MEVVATIHLHVLMIVIIILKYVSLTIHRISATWGRLKQKFSETINLNFQELVVILEEGLKTL